MAQDDDRWTQVVENMDLFFAQVGEISSSQRKMAAQFSINTQVIEQMLADQQTLAKRLDATEKAVAKLSMDKASLRDGRPGSPAGSDVQPESSAPRRSSTSGDPQSHRHGFQSYRNQQEVFGPSRNAIPKLSCPRFDGTHPKI